MTKTSLTVVSAGLALVTALLGLYPLAGFFGGLALMLLIFMEEQ